MPNKILLIVVLLFFFLNNAFTQNRLTGLVNDKSTGEPVEYAQVALLQLPDSTIYTGGITEFDGRFNLKTTLSGEHLIRISFVGYNPHYESVNIDNETKNVGKISLQPSMEQIDEVSVTAAATLFRSEADRRIYSVENMTFAEGGTAMELLETLPSVQVDEEGNISMLGSGNIMIYINGRPTNLSSDYNESILDQFPANAIKDIELITNPSARYDAEGIGGIINLVLREQKMQGFNGQFNLSAGTGNKYTGGVNLNLRQNRWNLFSNYSYQYREFWEENKSFSERFTGSQSPFVDQDYYTENFNHSHLVRFGAEYELTDNSSVRAFSTVNARSRDRERIYNIRSFSVFPVLDSMYVRFLEEDQSRMNYEIGAGYSWNDGNGKSLSANATASWDSQDRIEYFNQQYFDENMNEVEEKLQDQFYERPLSARLLVFELDYSQNFGDQIKLETGLKSTLRHDDRSQNFGQLNLSTNIYEEVILDGMPINNRFTRDENVYAGYLIFRNTNEGRFNYMVGLRAEFTTLKTFQQHGLRKGFFNDENFIPATDTTATNDHFGLFPSLFMNYELSANHDLQLSYSRRIQRPGLESMMPFLNAQDFYNLRLGNPFLEPAFTNNFEMNYIRSWESFTVTGGVFHRQTGNGISRLFVPFDQGAMVTWNNSNTVNDTGIELINYYSFSPNADVTLSGNYYYSVVKGELEGNPYNNESYSWTVSLLGNMNIPKWFRTQISANYWGPRIIPQGKIDPVFSMNLGLRKNVLNNNGTISFNVGDLLNTRHFSLETTSESFYQKREFVNESRVFTLSFTWRFRNFAEQNERSTNNGIERDIEGLF
jgi:outer membrane receptor protein involved in Fe transport